MTRESPKQNIIVAVSSMQALLDLSEKSKKKQTNKEEEKKKNHKYHN